jgi:hypothetical protein
MPGFIVNVTSTVNCSHGAKATIAPGQPRVKIGGQFAAVLRDMTSVAGCPFQVPVGAGTKPQPCVKIQWTVPAARVKVNRQFVLVQSSTGICQSAEQIPQGPPVIAATQVRVKAM